MREPRWIISYRTTRDLKDMKLADLVLTVKYYMDRNDSEDIKEATVELDRRLGTSLREAIGAVNTAWQRVFSEYEKARAEAAKKDS